jgi:predicted O-methyltransferase YrrM
LDFATVASAVEGLPNTDPAHGRILFDVAASEGVSNILELGFAWGVSTCYMAAGLDQKGAGHIITMDLYSALEHEPNLPKLLDGLSLSRYVDPVLAHRSYTWELMKLLQSRTIDDVCEPLFDFCFIDGAHAWEPDGLAFYLAEKLLRPGGWLLFDDMQWSYATSPTLRDSDWVKELPEDERVVPQVERVFTLLVRQHPNIVNIRVDNNWGWAQKRADVRVGSRPLSKDLIDRIYVGGIRGDAAALIRKIMARARLSAKR